MILTLLKKYMKFPNYTRCKIIFTIFGIFIEPYKSRCGYLVSDVSNRNGPSVP